MTNYYYKTQEFGVTDNGIHLLRSGFHYETISFSQIQKLEIKKGKELNNWVVILVIGLFMLLPGLYISSKIIDVILYGDTNVRGARMILLIFIPMIGAYFIYRSLRTGPILVIKYGLNEYRKFPIQSIADEQQLDNFALLLKDKLRLRT